MASSSLSSLLSSNSCHQNFKELVHLTSDLEHALSDPLSERVGVLNQKVKEILEVLRLDERFTLNGCYRWRQLNSECLELFSNCALLALSASQFKRVKVDLAGPMRSIRSLVQGLFIDFSRGGLSLLPKSLQEAIFSFSPFQDVVALAQVSHGCKNLAYMEKYWMGFVAKTGIIAEEVVAAGSSRAAFGAAHMNFYKALYQVLSGSASRALEFGHSMEVVNLRDETALSRRDSIQKLIKNMRNTCFFHRTIMNLSHSNLTLVPGWIWKFLPKIDKLTLNGNRIKTLPLEIFQLQQLRILDCSQNQLHQLPQGAIPSSLQEFHLARNNFKVIPGLIFSMPEGSFLSFSLNDIPLIDFEKLKEEKPTLIVEHFMSMLEHLNQGRATGCESLERSWRPDAFLEEPVFSAFSAMFSQSSPKNLLKNKD